MVRWSVSRPEPRAPGGDAAAPRRPRCRQGRGRERLEVAAGHEDLAQRRARVLEVPETRSTPRRRRPAAATGRRQATGSPGSASAQRLAEDRPVRARRRDLDAEHEPHRVQPARSGPGRAGLDGRPGGAAVVDEVQVVLDVARAGTAPASRCSVTAPGRSSCLGGDRVQPGQPVGAGDGDDAAVRQVDGPRPRRTSAARAAGRRSARRRRRRGRRRDRAGAAQQRAGRTLVHGGRRGGCARFGAHGGSSVAQRPMLPARTGRLSRRGPRPPGPPPCRP